MLHSITIFWWFEPFLVNKIGIFLATQCYQQSLYAAIFWAKIFLSPQELFTTWNNKIISTYMYIPGSVCKLSYFEEVLKIKLLIPQFFWATCARTKRKREFKLKQLSSIGHLMASADLGGRVTTYLAVKKISSYKLSLTGSQKPVFLTVLNTPLYKHTLWHLLL
jgi:hypothetical protein